MPEDTSDNTPDAVQQEENDCPTLTLVSGPGLKQMAPTCGPDTCNPVCTPSCGPSCTPCFPFGRCQPQLTPSC